MKNKMFSFENCSSEALKFTNRRAFFEGSPAAYEALRKRKLLDKACAHMKLSPLYSYVRWTDEAVMIEAAKYKNRAEFRRNNQGAYGYALKNGLLDFAFPYIRGGSRFWHLFELMAVSMKYSEKRVFIKSERQAYNFANKNKLVDIACAHMSKSNVDWDKESVMRECAKYPSRGLFQTALPGAYKHADKHGYLNEACAHMKVTRREMSKDVVLELAKKYKTRSEFQVHDGSAYVHARLGGFLDEACAHMTPGLNGFSKEKAAVLYHLRITMSDGTQLYKIGTTNRSPEARVAGMGVQGGATVEILDAITFESGRDARIAEKRLHRRLSDHRYSGQPVMKNGNTELFTVNVLEFDQARRPKCHV